MVAVTEFAAASIEAEQVRLLVTPYRHCLTLLMECRAPDGTVTQSVRLELPRDTVGDLAKFVARWLETLATLDHDAGEARSAPEAR
jgi:hypothetical protein